jgi:hypothetical protein
MDDVEAGRIIDYDDNFWDKIRSKVQENIKNNVEIPDYVRP